MGGLSGSSGAASLRTERNCGDAHSERQAIRQRERKRDMRRKILLGAALIEHAHKNERVARYVQRIIDGLEGRDRDPFDTNLSSGCTLTKRHKPHIEGVLEFAI